MRKVCRTVVPGEKKNIDEQMRKEFKKNFVIICGLSKGKTVEWQCRLFAQKVAYLLEYGGVVYGDAFSNDAAGSCPIRPRFISVLPDHQWPRPSGCIIQVCRRQNR